MVRLVAPDGTVIVQYCALPAAPETPLTGVPFCSSLPPGVPGSPGSPPPPPAASTAALALTMPAPIGCEGVDGNARAVLLIRASTCAGVLAGLDTDWISATTPATCGAAIEVPL